jgi:hypothetical protein
MMTWLKHPATWLTLCLTTAVLLWVGISQQWTAQKLADQWRRRISEAEDAQAVAYLPRLASLQAAAVPHLVQLLDDDRPPIRTATRELLRDRVQFWLRARGTEQQRCLACLAQEFAAQPLPREVQEREFVKQVSLKLLRWPAEDATIDTAQLLLDCTTTLQRIAETKPMELPVAQIAVLAPPEPASPVTISLDDLTDDPPLADADPPPEPELLTTPAPVIEREMEEGEPPPLAREGTERLIPPERFVPETPRRMRAAEQNANESEPEEKIAPTANSDPLAVQTQAMRELETRAIIRHLHGLPVVSEAAEIELRSRGFNDYTIKFAWQLDDPNPQVRLRLVEALPFVEQINSTAWLFELTNDTDAQVRNAARNILSTSRNPQTQRRLGNSVRR